MATSSVNLQSQQAPMCVCVCVYRFVIHPNALSIVVKSQSQEQYPVLDHLQAQVKE